MKKQEFIRKLWQRAGEDTYKAVDVRVLCAEHDLSEQKAADWIDGSYPILEYGVSPMHPWFIGNPNN